MALAGTPAASDRSRTWLAWMVFPLFPSVPVEVEKTMVPLEVEVLAPSTTQDSMVLLVASLVSVKVEPLVLVLRRSRNIPLPATRPSKTIRSAPFKRIRPVADDPEIVRTTAALDWKVTV